MRRITAIAVSLILWEAGVVGRAGANPIVSLAGAAAFASAIRPPAQNLRPVSSPGDIATQNKIFPGANGGFRGTTLYTNTAPLNGMVSATGSAADLNRRINGGYVYDYKLDPDLSGYSLDVELFFPQVGNVGDPGIDTLGIALTDQTGNAKVWRFDHTVLAAGVPETFSFDLSDGAGAGGSTSFFMDPGFDLGHVQTVQVADEGTLTATFPPPPPADPGFPPAPATALWFGTERFAVVPEPAPTLIFALGIACAAVWRGRRRDRTMQNGRNQTHL